MWGEEEAAFTCGFHGKECLFLGGEGRKISGGRGKDSTSWGIVDGISQKMIFKKKFGGVKGVRHAWQRFLWVWK